MPCPQKSLYRVCLRLSTTDKQADYGYALGTTGDTEY